MTAVVLSAVCCLLSTEVMLSADRSLLLAVRSLPTAYWLLTTVVILPADRCFSPLTPTARHVYCRSSDARAGRGPSLGRPDGKAEAEALRRCERTGRPAGSERFMAWREGLVERRPRLGRPGLDPRNAESQVWCPNTANTAKG